MARSLLFGVVTFALFGVAPQVEVHAQSILDDLYGQGVHAYFAGDYEASSQWLGQAIAQGTQDPRAFYYRGLANLKMGEAAQAEADFAKGAEIETAGTERYYPIANSLSRVQGNARSSIETARRQARSTAQARELARQKARYEETLQAEARVLRGSGQPVAEVPAVQIAGDIELPFPSEQPDVNANTDFAVLGGPSLANAPVALDPTPRTTAPPADPSDPFASRGDPSDPSNPPKTPGDATDPFGKPTQVTPAAGDPPTGTTPPVADGKVNAGRLMGGLFRALGSTLPDPSKAAQLIPGAPDLSGQQEDNGFDPTLPETPSGDDPFGKPGNGAGNKDK